MARQGGAILLRGTIDNINFFKLGNKYFFRSKVGIAGDRIKTDPAFQRSRENSTEFGTAARAGKLVREAIKRLPIQATNVDARNRLTKLMIQVLQSDLTSTRGERTVNKGNLSLLEGFNFNREAILSQRFAMPMSSTVDRSAGRITLHIPSFVPDMAVSAPSGTSHFKIISAGILADFDAQHYEADVAESVAFALNHTTVSALTIEHWLPAGTIKPILLVAGVQFMQELNGVLYPLLNGAFNAAAIIRADG